MTGEKKVEIKQRQIWRDVDPRHKETPRYVRIESTRDPAFVAIRSVVWAEDHWRDAPKSRASYARRSRFGSKTTDGYILHEDVKAD